MPGGSAELSLLTNETKSEPILISSLIQILTSTTSRALPESLFLSFSVVMRSLCQIDSTIMNNITMINQICGISKLPCLNKSFDNDRM